MDKLKKYLYFRLLTLLSVMAALIFFALITLTIISLKNIYLLIFSAICWILAFLLLIFANNYIYKPYKEFIKVLNLFNSGYTLQGLFEQKTQLTPEIESTILKFRELINASELITSSRKQAQYLALQNQINPHFLYNTLEGIRGEALCMGLDSVAEMTEALATFFRYTSTNVENLVTLEDELQNIENYYIIQRYRFGERLTLSVKFSCEDEEEENEISKHYLPKLTLQPIVENAIYHGIERKVGKGTVSLKIEASEKRLIIIISDDGLGMDFNRLSELNQRLTKMALEYDNSRKGGIAMVNVNSRIKLLYGEEYGINVYSTVNQGTDVEITLPAIKEASYKGK